MGHGVVRIDLPERASRCPIFLFGKTPTPNEGSIDILVECDLGSGQQAHGNVRFPIAASPRVSNR